jgi:hypothetical protein
MLPGGNVSGAAGVSMRGPMMILEHRVSAVTHRWYLQAREVRWGAGGLLSGGHFANMSLPSTPAAFMRSGMPPGWKRAKGVMK